MYTRTCYVKAAHLFFSFFFFGFIHTIGLYERSHTFFSFLSQTYNEQCACLKCECDVELWMREKWNLIVERTFFLVRDIRILVEGFRNSDTGPKFRVIPTHVVVLVVVLYTPLFAVSLCAAVYVYSTSMTHKNGHRTDLLVKNFSTKVEFNNNYESIVLFFVSSVEMLNRK